MLYYFINIIFLLVATLNRYYKAHGKEEPQINVKSEHVINSAGNLDW